MAESSGLWNRNSNMQTIDPNEKLFLFGYSCKIFRDDEKAKYIDQGKHLIPWMGDESLMIDRYDVRGYLHDLKQYEPKPGQQFEQLDSEEEKLCDEERYRSLRSDLTEEQLYQEEELKRLRAAVASDGAYHEIGFSYDNDVEKVETAGSKAEEPEDEPYEPPAGLNIKKGIQVPSNMKIHAIIEKTALFVSEQGGQMEIIIKMKQQHNPQFGFMHLDNPLYPYYKFLMKEIKSGSYKPVQTKKVSRSEDEDEDGHYLHPSLLSGKKENVPKFTVPSINFKRSQDDSYSVLVRNLQQQFAEEKLAKEKQKEQPKKEVTVQENQGLVNYTVDETSKKSSTNNSGIMVIPPSEIRPIIQKMAEYVAKNGEDFEYVVKSKKDKRFEFLESTSEYYAYYLKCRHEAKLIFQPPPPPPPDIDNEVPVSSEQQPLVSEAYNVQSAEGTYAVQIEHTSHPYGETLEQKLTEHQPSELQYIEQQPVEQLPAEQQLVQQQPAELQQPVEQQTAEQQSYDEFDALYTQDSQDAVFRPEPVQKLELPTDDLSNSDSVDSLGLPKETKSKTSKLKGPICFSLKPKETDNVPPEKLKIPLLLDDSDEEEDAEGTQKEKSEPNRRKSVDDSRSASTSRHESVEKEEKPKLTSEMEAKMAEERMKDKLLAAARERLVQQKKEKRLEMERQRREEQLKKDRQMMLEQQMKEKQLQLERKKKAALFLKMLKKRDPELDTIEGRLGAEKKSRSNKGFWNSAENAQNLSTGNGVLLSGSKIHINTTEMSTTTIPGIKNDWSESSASEESGEEIMITEFCSNPDAAPEATKVPEPVPEPEKVSESNKHDRKKKKKRRSRSRSRERHPRSYRSRDRHRSRSPRNHKHEKSKKEKELPAAYALVRSRSRSRSPRRYRQNPSYWGRRR